MDPQSLPSKSLLGQYMQPKKLIHYGKDGVPRPYTDWLLPKNRIDDVLLAAFHLPYTGSPDPRNPGEIILEPEYCGLTNIEVACIKQAQKAASGDLESLKFTVERLIGKPKQQIEQTTVTMSLKEYLEALDIESITHQASTVVDAVAEEVKYKEDFDV